MPRRLASSCTFGLALAAAAGCRPSAPPPLRTSVALRDSAGIRIVESSAPGWPAGGAWTVADSPTVDLGAPDGMFVGFRHPSAAARLSDGRIVVADGGYDQLLFFGRDGRFLYTVGSAGKAPGQFQALWGVYRAAGDTVVAFDVAASRITRFDPNGALVDTASLAVPAGSNGFLPVGMDSLGNIALLRDQTPIPFPGRVWSVIQNPGVLLRFSVKGVPLDSVSGFSAGEVFGLPAPQAGGGTVLVPANRPFGRSAAVAVRGDTLWLGTGAALAFTAYVGGRPVRVVRVARPPAVIPESVVAQFKARQRATAASGDVMDSVFTASLDSVPFPDYFPGHGRALADPAGDLWVQDPGIGTLTAGDPGLGWSVFDRTGAWLGVVALPARFTPWEAGADHLLGVWSPADGGAPHVRVYPLRKPAPDTTGSA
jgi:hypothetical protein